ncbi:unnamed protein product [Pleuronectes platessa]|uniref:Uncharacterized protein n=1 Tax=Pleuronectes platessa TaxID=8262 RepID=A0A9N7YBP2_PLEPL|nr:unnamed protein product [Pleuronectes platessa]
MSASSDSAVTSAANKATFERGFRSGCDSRGSSGSNQSNNRSSAKPQTDEVAQTRRRERLTQCHPGRSLSRADRDMFLLVVLTTELLFKGYQTKKFQCHPKLVLQQILMYNAACLSLSVLLSSPLLFQHPPLACVRETVDRLQPPKPPPASQYQEIAVTLAALLGATPCQVQFGDTVSCNPLDRVGLPSLSNTSQNSIKEKTEEQKSREGGPRGRGIKGRFSPLFPHAATSQW